MKASSMFPLLSQGGRSAQVTMRLLVNGFSIPVTQMGRDFLLVESPVNHPPTDASLILQVDQTERCWSVRLPEGISTASKRVAIAKGGTSRNESVPVARRFWSNHAGEFTTPMIRDGRSRNTSSRISS